MNYESNYYDYINYIKNIERDLEYSEKHHIIPRCLGGSDDKENLVILTAREHFLAHYLLTKIYPDNYKLIDAFRMMGVINENEGQKRYINSRLYESKKKLFSKARSKEVVCIETGEIFPSATYVEKNIINGIRDVIKGKQLTAGGYHWRYLNEEPIVKEPRKRKKVICANNKKIYPSTLEVAKELGVNESLIRSVCNNEKNHNTAKGLTFYYYDEEKPAEEYIIKKSNSHDFFKKKVICIDTNEEYESATDAAIILYNDKTKMRYISQCCNGLMKTYKGMHWSFVDKIKKND